jgi:hypothetical protein
MAWDGVERRNSRERRLHERRRTMRYNVHTLVIVDGITWVDPEGGNRRQRIRRREDREMIASKVSQYTRP